MILKFCIRLKSHKLKQLKGELVAQGNGNFQIKHSNSLKPKILEYMLQFQNKLAKKSFLIPASIASNPLEWSSLITDVDGFIRKHTNTVWYQVHENKSSVTLAGYAAVIALIEDNVIKKFVKSQAKKTKALNEASPNANNNKTESKRANSNGL